MTLRDPLIATTGVVEEIPGGDRLEGQWVFQGAWSGATAYLIGDVVTYSNVTYLCIADHTNHQPPNATYWSVLAAGPGSSGVVNPSLNGFRLTLVSGDPVPITDQTGKTTIYWTPTVHNLISLYDGAAWNTRSCGEVTLALNTLTSGKNYDVFIYDSSGVPLPEIGPAWTNDTTRSTALVLQDGVWVKSGATTRRYVGTFRTTSTTTTEDSVTNRFLWNVTNQVQKRINLPGSSANSHTYATGSWRKFNNNDANSSVYAVIGIGGMVNVIGGGDIYGNGGGTNSDCRVGVCVSNDSSQAIPPINQYLPQSANSTGAGVVMMGVLAIGLNYFRVAEWASVGTGTFAYARIDGSFAG